MKFTTLLKVIPLLLCLFLAQCTSEPPKQARYMRLASGPPSGVYYTAGIAIAEIVNKSNTSQNIDITVETSPGSIANINDLSNGKVDFALAQADREYQAYHGKGYWKSNRQEKLRFICSLHQEALTLLAAEDSGIVDVSDLEGKRVAIGAPGSGTRDNVLEILQQKGLDSNKDFQAQSITLSESIKKFENGQIDAFFVMVGHPNGAIQEATNHPRRSSRFIPLTKLRALVKDSPYFSKVYIPTDYYPAVQNEGPVPTIGTVTTLLTSEDVPNDIVYEITKTLFDNLEVIKTKHPSFINLSRKSMQEGAFCPIHPGAQKFYSTLKSKE